MVNFRFHIVSLVAVFLALALGIGMGVTVIDKATVDLLQNRLNNVRNDVRDANAQGSRLQIQIDQSNKFVDEASAYLVNNRLDGVAVTIIRISGADNASIDQLAQLITESGGFVRGSLTVSDRANLGQADDIDDLSSALGVGTRDQAQLRTQLTERLASAVAGNSPSSGLRDLETQGFIAWSPGPNVGDLGTTSFAGGRVVVASGPTVRVANDVVGHRLVRQMERQATGRVLAVDTGLGATNDRQEVRSAFVKPLIDDAELRTNVSTVDNLEQKVGRVAAVLALSDLGVGRAGHYGVGTGATSILPPLARR